MKAYTTLLATDGQLPTGSRSQAQADQRPTAVAQRQALAALASSPRQTAQRQVALPAGGPVAQLGKDEDKERAAKNRQEPILLEELNSNGRLAQPPPQEYATSPNGQSLALVDMGNSSQAERHQELLENRAVIEADEQGQQRGAQRRNRATETDMARTTSDASGALDKLRHVAAVGETVGNVLHHGAVSQKATNVTGLVGGALGAVGSVTSALSNIYGVATGNQSRTDKLPMVTSALSSLGSVVSGAGSATDTLNSALHLAADETGGVGGTLTGLSDLVGGSAQAVVAHRRRDALKPTENTPLLDAEEGSYTPERALLTDLAYDTQAGKRRTGVGTAVSGLLTGIGGAALLAGASSPVGWGLMTAGATTKGLSWAYNKYQSNQEAKKLVEKHQSVDAVKQSANNIRYTGYPGPLGWRDKVKTTAAAAYSYLPHMPYLSSQQATQVDDVRKQFATGTTGSGETHEQIFKKLGLGEQASEQEKYAALSS